MLYDAPPAARELPRMSLLLMKNIACIGHLRDQRSRPFALAPVAMTGLGHGGGEN